MEVHQLKNNNAVMKNIVNYFLLIIMFFLFSCSYSASDYTTELGEGYTFVSESNAHQIISGPTDTTWTGIIPCTVVAYEYDSTYIIARQKSNPECLEEDISNLPIAYWIIDKKKKTTYGPLDYLSFVMKRKELTMSSSLKFKK